MGKILMTAVASMLAALCSGSIQSLWSSLEDARKADRPADEAAILQKIQTEASRQHLTWDFYKSWEEYVNVRSRTNWKLYQETREKMDTALEEFGEPVAIFYHRHAGADFLNDNEEGLRKSSNPEFWKNDYRVSGYPYRDAVTAALGNDWDYACYACRRSDNFKGRYPLDAFLEYEGLERDSLQAYADRYKGKAVSLLARQDILESRLYREGEDYIRLKEDCEAFEKERKTFSGSEALIARSCLKAGYTLDALKSKALFPSVSKGLVTVGFRNMSRASFIIKDKNRTVWKGTITNGKQSLYRTDTVKVAMPGIPDGEYDFVCGEGTEQEVKGAYRQYTLSIAVRTNASGPGFYVADYVSGEPLKKASLLVCKNGEKVYEGAEISLMDGYTPVPDDILERIKDSRNLSIAAKTGDRLSQPLRITADQRLQDIGEKPLRRCEILTDRAAYTPGETLSFKCIVYDGTYHIRPAVDMDLTARMNDAEGNEIGSSRLITNEFGTAAGTFVLKRCNRGGTYCLMLEDGKGALLASRTVRVDDYVLPTFDLMFTGGDEILEGTHDTLSVSGTALAYSGHSLGSAKAEYIVDHDGMTIASSPLLLEKDGSFNFSFSPVIQNPLPWYDFYRITVRITDATGETLEFHKSISIRRPQEPEQGPKEHFSEEIEGSDIAFRVVSCYKPTWAVVELYGSGNVLLAKNLVKFTGETTIRYAYDPSWPDALTLNVLYFQDKSTFRETLRKRREIHEFDLPLSFSRFLDTTVPATRYEFTIKTGTDVECAATVFDKSTETVRPNEWDTIKATAYPFPSIGIRTSSGTDRSDGGDYGTKNARVMVRGKANGATEEEAIPFQLAESKPAFDATDAAPAPSDGYIRENFANTIAWEPFLKSDADGNIRFEFTNADKLSTYYVQLFAHDRKMRNAVLRREMKVTIPVKVAVVEPRFLYMGDLVTVSATVSNATDSPVSGTVSFNGGKGIPVMVPAHGSSSADLGIEAGTEGDLPLKIVFKADNPAFGSDGVLIHIPVRKAVQALTEAHSSLFKAGMDKDVLAAGLRAQFVNIPGSETTMKEISIMDMINEALPEEVEPRGENSLSLASAILARHLIGQDFTELMSKLLTRRQGNGGFVWFDGMECSPVVTSVILEMLEGLLPEAERSVRYLDTAYAKGRTTPRWCQWITTAQYLYVRSLYSKVPLNEDLGRDRKKEVREYLVPGKERGNNGMVFLKARRAATLRNFCASSEGTALVRKLGVTLFASSRMSASAEKDTESLRQYAVEHSSGGTYFPNAVIPWRGLLESELYAHVFLCRLFDGTAIADGIRLWLMVQKETQQWKSDPAYIQALQAVMAGSDELKQTRVIALSGTFEKSFDEVGAAGNGFTISEQMKRELKFGDKVTLSCKIHSDENRSFVRVSVPFPAGLLPVDQLSGYKGWKCYRSVLKDRIEYWFDTFPEEDLTLSEQFFVQREGEFQSPAAEVVCLYADHYRANTDAVEKTKASR